MNLSIVLPTYNESENIKQLIPELQANFQDAEIIVVDDNSPDGTARVAQELAAKVVVRTRREGLGAALKDGYDRARNDIIVSMDADLSLAVKDIYRLLAYLDEYDLVIGSKYSRGSIAKGFDSKVQRVLSYLGNRFFILLFRLPVDDTTLNFRAFKQSTWRTLNLQEKTNVFLLEMLIDAQHQNLKIKQIPILFSKRYYGHSKTNLKKLFPQYLKFLLKRLACRLK